MNDIVKKQIYLRAIKYIDLLLEKEQIVKGLPNITICVLDQGVIESKQESGNEVPVHEAFDGIFPFFIEY